METIGARPSPLRNRVSSCVPQFYADLYASCPPHKPVHGRYDVLQVLHHGLSMLLIPKVACKMVVRVALSGDCWSCLPWPAGEQVAKLLLAGAGRTSVKGCPAPPPLSPTPHTMRTIVEQALNRSTFSHERKQASREELGCGAFN